MACSGSTWESRAGPQRLPDYRQLLDLCLLVVAVHPRVQHKGDRTVGVSGTRTRPS